MGELHISRYKKFKLEYIRGLKGTLKNGMEDYMKGREMRTVVKDEKS